MKTTTIQTVTVKKSYFPDESIDYEEIGIYDLDDSIMDSDISVNISEYASIDDIVAILMSYADRTNQTISELIRLIIYIIEARLRKEYLRLNRLLKNTE